MKNNKTPGESGVTTEALKALSDYGKDFIVSMIKSFWENDQKRYDEWKTALLRLLQKKDLKKPSQTTEALPFKMLLHASPATLLP
jgi:hypothetical protein